MPPIPFHSTFAVRRGVTLLELLIVLVLMGMAASVVAPVLVQRPLQAEPGEAELITDARRTAVRRGEPVRLRLSADGVWALVALRDGQAIRSGRLDSAEIRESSEVDLRIDAMGTCTPAGRSNTSSPKRRAAFDMLTCRFEADSAR